MPKKLNQVVGNVTFIREQGHTNFSQGMQNGSEMLDIEPKVIGINDDIINITMCVVSMIFENPIHIFLHMRWTAHISHRNNIKHLLPSISNDCCLSSIAFVNISLVI